MAPPTIIRIDAEEVVWLRAESLDDLVRLLKELRPEPGVPGYAIDLAGRQRFVFGGGNFTALWKTVAGERFEPAAVRGHLLSGPRAGEISPGAEPDGPAYEPDLGAIWVRVGTRSEPKPALPEKRAATRRYRMVLEDATFERLYRQPAAEPDRGDGSLTRTPHLVPSEESPAPGDEFSLDVFCDGRPSDPGEQAVDVSVELPAGMTEAKLTVWLALSAHFAAGRRTGSVTLREGEEESTHEHFELAVVPSPPPGPGRISAVFSYDGRPCGQVTRLLPIGGQDGGPGPPAPPPPGAAIHALTGTERADLTIEIKALDEGEEEFSCRVITPARPNPEPTSWKLKSRAPDLVSDYFKDFTEPELDDAERTSRLVGAGMKLWEAAPREFRDVFWDLVDGDDLPKSIFVVTDDWAFPWELLVPARRTESGGTDKRQPLGVEFAVGRWVTDKMISPPQRLELVDSYAFAPEYADAPLPHADAEAEYVCTNLNGTRIDPASFDQLETCFRERGVALAHFACHGKINGTRQALMMENGKSVISSQIAGMVSLSAALSERHPMVFLNACELGRPQPALVGVGGFATEFIAAGASCVIAPVWSVEDGVAHELATELYDAVRAGDAPATALAALRARAYGDDGADSWAAYSFYGDPLMRISTDQSDGDNEGE